MAQFDVLITDKDLFVDLDLQSLDRYTAPLDVERRTVQTDLDAPLASLSYTLTEMAKDYEFFTPGVIYATTPFPHDVVLQFMQECPSTVPEEDPVIVDCDSPCFSGLGKRLVGNEWIDFDVRLYAIRKSRWELLRNMLAGLVMIDTAAKYDARTNFYRFDILDQYAASRGKIITKIPTVSVTVFGVSANNGFFYLAPVFPPRVPYLVQEPPKSDMERQRLISRTEIGEDYAFRVGTPPEC